MKSSKEYYLYTDCIYFDLIEDTLEMFEKSNPEIKFGIYENIPEWLMDDYVSFSIEAEKNTRGLLQPGETPKISIEKILRDYNTGGTDQFYFDLLAFDSEKWIVGKLSARGFRHESSFNIYQLYVTEDFRGRKIGEYLLLKTLKIAVAGSPHLTSFVLQTYESNPAVQKIIEKIGFAEV